MFCHLGQQPQQHRAEGLTFLPIQSLQLQESIPAGHKNHLDSCASAFCVAAVWFEFSPCPYSVFESCAMNPAQTSQPLKAAELQ